MVQFFGRTRFHLRDPDGYILEFDTPFEAYYPPIGVALQRQERLVAVAGDVALEA